MHQRRYLFILLLLALLGGTWYWLFGDLPAPAELTNRLATPSIHITDRHGRTLYNILDQHGGRHTPLPLDQIPLPLQQATIATEDRNFYDNPGVDLEGIARALWINLQGGEVLAGGSTITQQLARNLLLTADERTERTLRRKLRESWLAWRIARTFSKDDILAIYLNQSYYGGLAYGVEAAAQTFFGKPATQLTLAESALIAGLTQSPALYNPLLYPETAQERQQTVLRLLRQEGYITADDYDLALRQPLRYSAEPYPIRAPHFVMMVQASLDRLYTPEQLVESGGLVVRTTLDLDWQTAAEATVAHQLERLNNPNYGGIGSRADNAAVVALHPATGEILVLVGSPDFFNHAISGAINMAVQPRQPGSALKPFIYALGMEPNYQLPITNHELPLFTAATMFLDVRTSFTTRKGETYVPVNFSRTEHGPVTLREALGSSLNIPAVQALNHLGVEVALERLPHLGFALPRPADEYDLALALGGGEVTLLELTTAYAMLANGGELVAPRFILEVTTAAGEPIYTPPPPAPQRVLDERVAWLMSDILSDDEARHISFGRHSVLNVGRTAAVKTGTTNDFRDNWTVGYTPSLAVGVWVGNADQSPMLDATGLTGAGPIWHNTLRQLLRNTPDEPFAQPTGLTELAVCYPSGQLPTAVCPAQHLEWFIAGTEPTTADTLYHLVTLDKLTGHLATEGTPPTDRIQKLVLDLPATAQPWAEAQGVVLLSQVQLGEARGDCGWGIGDCGLGDGSGAERPRIFLLSPDNNLTYRLSPQLPPEAQRLRLAAAAELPLAELTFWLNGEPLATLNAPPYEVWWPLASGEFTLSVSGRTTGGTAVQGEQVFFRVRGEGE